MTALAVDHDDDEPAGDTKIRIDLQLIADMVPAGARVLDIGCGDGALLDHLVHFKDVDGRGIEISQAGVNACVSRGLPVIQGDADTDLSDYPSGSFDFVILSQTLQATRHPRRVLLDLVRIGRRAVVSFPNFGHWNVRLDLLLQGRMPRTPALPEKWYKTQNIHMCTIADFQKLCGELGIKVERSLAVDASARPSAIPRMWFANLTAVYGVFLLHKPEVGDGVERTRP
jgi:methionine biosynthesis protein MetW